MADPKQLQWLEISRSALLSNLQSVRKQVGKKPKIMAMVKANAYGHGLESIAPLIYSKIDYYGVNTIQEALTIRGLNITKPILILGPVAPADFRIAEQYNISLSAHSLDYLQKISSFKIHIHLKINTGMNRLGLSMIELLSALGTVRHSPRLTIEGIYTHFHSSDSDKTSTLVQLDRFQQSVFQTRYYFPAVIAHCANTAAIYNYPQTHLDMVRLGIGLYGLWPGLKPVLSWKCLPVQIRRIKAGETVGYSANYTCSVNGLMAILPVGYSDGLDRGLSNTGRVWMADNYYPIIGNIAMNFTAIDISNLKDLSGQDLPSPVELIGSHVTVDEIAKRLDTINYEVVSRLNPAVGKLIVK